MNTPDILAAIADHITGFIRIGTAQNGPFVKLVANISEDSREIIITATDYGLSVVGDRTVKLVLNLSSQTFLDTEPTPCPATTSRNGVVDPVIATPDRSTA